MSETELAALTEEFVRSPFARHSTALRILLNQLRAAPLTGKYCLIELRPHQLWQLAKHGAVRGEGPIPVEGVTFTSLLDAEIEIFRRRVQELQYSKDGLT
jgi:N,N-dimethylformamidase